MPIRINLLAEAQAAEESRRKDPVKRAALGAVVVLVLVAAWASTIQLKVLSAKRDLGALAIRWKSIEKSYQDAVDCQRRGIEAEYKLGALQQLTTNRFLQGPVLNALQQSLNGVDDVSVVHYKTEQSYIQNEETKARTNDTRVIPSRPPSATERVKVVIDAIDTSGPAGARINKFKDSIAAVPWFRDSLEKTNGVRLTNRGGPQNSPNGRGSFVMFSVEANFPEKTR